MLSNRIKQATSIAEAVRRSLGSIGKLLEMADSFYALLADANTGNPLEQRYRSERAVLRAHAALIAPEFVENGGPRPVTDLGTVLASMEADEQFGGTMQQARQYQDVLAALTPLAKLAALMLGYHMVEAYLAWDRKLRLDELQALQPALEALHLQVLQYCHPDHDRLVNAVARM